MLGHNAISNKNYTYCGLITDLGLLFSTYRVCAQHVLC